jgi:hypothetical protein
VSVGEGRCLVKEITVTIGRYPDTFTASTAGPWGCDPCWSCSKRPSQGATVWMNCYGDLYCDPCLQNKARLQARAESRAHTDPAR